MHELSFFATGEPSLVGSRGIARMIAEALLRQGAGVYLCAQGKGACDQAAAELSACGRCVSLSGDDDTVEGIHQLVRTYSSNEQVLDVLVN